MDKISLIKNIKEYVIITISIILMVIGVYFFKFPNNFSFGGVTGYSTIIGRLTSISATRFTLITNVILLMIGLIVLGKGFAFKTIYASTIFLLGLEILEKYIHISSPITNQPLLELIFAILIPGITSAILFDLGASSGGTDIIAMIFKKYTNFNIGILLLAVDCIAVIMSFFVFGATTGLFSSLGLLAKTLVIDDAIEIMNMRKYFTIVCENPEPICNYIIHELNRSATVYDARGAYQQRRKTIVLATMNRMQAIKLRNFIRLTDPKAFMIITKSSEIIGKGFLDR